MWKFLLGKPWKSDALPSDLFDMVVNDATLLEKAARVWLREHPRNRTWDVPRCLDDMSGDVLTVALDQLEGELPDTESVRAVLECVRSGMADGFATGTESERRLLVTLRHSEPAREKLEAFFARQGR